ncbi:MAG TPA: class I SAM-dependent methyltransferase [Candidatus Tectomicrobia bacterium]
MMSTPPVSNIALWKEGVRQEWTAAAAGWRKWHAQMEVLSRAATEAIVHAAQITPGMHVLDLASGTGDPALSLALAVGPEGAVTATDLVPEMLLAAADHAQHRHVTNIAFQQADPETLPFPAQTFDVVTCRMGVMLFADVAQALREIHRVLKPEGRVAFIAQGAVDQNPWQASIMRVLRKYVQMPPPAAGAPHTYRFAQPGTLAQVLRDAGFRHVHEASQEVPWPWPGSPEQYWTYRCETGIRFRQYLASLPVATQASVYKEVLASIGAYYDGQQVNFTAVIVIASGVR